ncbi:MAG: hypothetical protein DRI34_09390 [Deltaproteobacteria bacterium]|nr:MAG: hypothetical protein DRI34_09390 [Deltaproteobacteria bacterium]
MKATGKKTVQAVLAVALGLALAFPAVAQPPGKKAGQRLAPDVQVKILLNSISYHQSPRIKNAAKIVIAVVHEESASSEQAAIIKAAFEKNGSTKIGKKPFSVVDISFTGITDLKKKLTAQGANVVYVVAGSEATARKSVSATRALKMLSVAGEPNYVHWLGVCLGVEATAGRRKILINLSGCKLEDVRFDPRLLRIATVSF